MNATPATTQAHRASRRLLALSPLMVLILSACRGWQLRHGTCSANDTSRRDSTRDPAGGGASRAARVGHSVLRQCRA